MRRPLLTCAVVAAAVFALDLWTKQWATLTLAGGPPVEILGPIVRFTYTRNSGVAFGLGAGFPFPYYLFSIAAVLIIVLMFARQRVQRVSRQLALALILGGALGNLIDRITTGQVVDFIEIGYGRWHWPVFNVADSAVTIGVALFAWTWPRREDGAATAGHEGAAATARREDFGDASRDEPGRPAAGHGGAAGSLPGRGADGPVA